MSGLAFLRAVVLQQFGDLVVSGLAVQLGGQAVGADLVLASATLVRKPAVQLIASSAWRGSPGHGVGCGDGALGGIARWDGFAAAPRLAGPGRRSSFATPKATTALMSELWP